MRKIKKIEVEKEFITCDTCGTDFEEKEYNTFVCIACHKDVCKNCVQQIEISFDALHTFGTILPLCPDCFSTLTLKQIKELDLNEK